MQPLGYVDFSDKDSESLFKIFDGHWGEEDKEDAEEKVLWYDFTPYNVKDPILLALMSRDHKAPK